MLKFNLTQEGKTLIDALQGDAKLTITKVLLRGSGFDNNTSKEITSFKGAVCNDGTGNGAYVVIDINDNSTSNYSCNVIELFSDQTKIATQCANEQSGYEVTLSCGERGTNKYPSITYRTQTWTSKKIPTNVQLSASMAGQGKQCGISFFGIGVNGSGVFDFENGNFPSTITFNNGDVWVTDETVSAAGVTEQADYYASTEMGETVIRPLFSKILIQKESNKHLKLRVACQFNGAEKCKFNTTSINLPYASKFREGVVRFADPASVYGTDGQRYNTVYSAADVDTKISQVTESLGNLDQYAKKAEANTFTADNTFDQNILVHGEIRGEAVATRGMNVNAKDTMVVSLGYADDRYLTKNDASSTYLTKTDAETTYLTKTEATQAANNYAKLNASNEFAAETTNTFNGNVTVKGTFVVGESQEAATFTVTAGGTITGNAIQSDKVSSPDSNLLPTEGAVKSALDDVESALQSKDNDLQLQIDGINAGQNLADIVNSTENLAAYDVSHLKAKGDSLPGKPSTTLTIGDKVQVLGGADVQSSVYELIKGTKPEGETNSIVSNTDGYYWHYIGVYGTNAYTKSEIDGKLGKISSAIDTKADTSYVNTELGKKANSADVYSKTDADTKFAQLAADNTFTGNNTFNGYITGNAVTSDIAEDIKVRGAKLTTSDGVSSFVNTVVDAKIAGLNLDTSYLKLTSSDKQTVESSVDFNGTIGGSAVTDTQMAEDAIPNSINKLVNLGFAEHRYAKLGTDNEFLGKNNTFQAITATTVTAQAFEGTGVAKQMSTQGTRLPTESAVASFVGDKFAENRLATSDKTKVGAMGLFLYTGGDFKEMGAEVNGTSLQAVGMQLPMDGVVSWSQGDAMPAGSEWKLLNNTIAGEPCLVLAICTIAAN